MDRLPPIWYLILSMHRGLFKPPITRDHPMHMPMNADPFVVSTPKQMGANLSRCCAKYHWHKSGCVQ